MARTILILIKLQVGIYGGQPPTTRHNRHEVSKCRLDITTIYIYIQQTLTHHPFISKRINSAADPKRERPPMDSAAPYQNLDLNHSVTGVGAADVAAAAPSHSITHPTLTIRGSSAH